jgi:Type IX secretion system protein PorV
MSVIRIIRSLLAIACAVLLSFGYTPNGFSQITTGELTGEVNTIQSAVPFLTIAPDSRAGSMGDVGVATSPDINSQHWNPAKYVFIEGEGGIAISYTPWLRNLIPDINLAYIAGYKRLDDKQVVSGSLRYFSLGNIVFTNISGGVVKNFTPNEFAIDGAYSRLFSDKFSGAIAFRFIRSDLTGGYSSTDVDTKAGTSVAADLAFFYTDKIEVSDKDAQLSFGANISNMGRKISYSENQEAAFIPINLRLGGTLDLEIDEYNSFAFSLDLNKLLVPTPPIYVDTTSDVQIIEFGKDPNVSVPLGMIRSFFDAPGVEKSDGSRSVFIEELHEITYSAGVEYWYRDQFAVRGGYFHEHETKGNRKFFTFGVGLKLNVFEIDFAYLVPTQTNNPLANTVRFTLAFDFDKLKNN